MASPAPLTNSDRRSAPLAPPSTDAPRKQFKPAALLTECPPPPAWMRDGYGREQWYLYGRILCDAGMLSELSLQPLSLFVKLFLEINELCLAGKPVLSSHMNRFRELQRSLRLREMRPDKLTSAHKKVPPILSSEPETEQDEKGTNKTAAYFKKRYGKNWVPPSERQSAQAASDDAERERADRARRSNRFSRFGKPQ